MKLNISYLGKLYKQYQSIIFPQHEKHQFNVFSLKINNKFISWPLFFKDRRPIDTDYINILNNLYSALSEVVLLTPINSMKTMVRWYSCCMY